MYDVCNGTGAGATTLVVTVGSGSAGTPQGAAAGDLVVVCGSSSNSFNVTNVTDSQANTYTAQVSDSGSGNQGAIWSSLISTALTAGTDTITVTFSGSTGKQSVIARGASGVSSATADQNAHASGSSTAADAGPTGPLSQARELVVSMIGNANTGGIPAGLSFGGAGVTVHSGSTGPYLTVFNESVSATTAVDASGTLAATAAWCALTATFPLSSAGGLTVTSTSPPAGVVGTSGYSYTLTAAGGSSPYTFSVSSGTLPAGLSLGAGSAGGHICGSSIAKVGTTAAEVAYYNTWNGSAASGGLGLYTAQARKIYFVSPNGPAQSGDFPTNATAALWESHNADVGACLTLGMGMHLCYRPVASGTYNDPGWPGGAIFASPGNASTPGTILGDYALMKASIQSLQAACTSVANGASVLSVILWQENDNKGGFPAVAAGGAAGNPYIASHNYFAYYPLLKADFPHLPVYTSYVNYPHGTAAQNATDWSQRFPGPSPLNPSGWGDGKLYCDGITTDEYADGAYSYTGTYPTGTVGTNSTGRLRYMYAEPDLYTPATGTTAASGNPGWADVADFNGIAWGNLETGNNASTGQPNLDQMQAYLVGIPKSNPAPIGSDKKVHSILSVYQKRVNAGSPVIGMCWYENPGNTTSGYNNITSSSDPRIPWLNAIDAATAQSTSPSVSGTPSNDSTVTYPYTDPVVIKVKDKAGTTATATLNFKIELALAVTTATLPKGQNGVAYSAQLQDNGGGSGTGKTWTSTGAGSLTGSGITLSSAGLLSGTGVTGTYSNLKFTVTDSESNTAQSAAMTLTIQAGTVTLAVSTASLPNGTGGQGYTQTLQAEGGTTPYTWTVSPAGALSGSGLTLGSNGVINGTAVAGTYPPSGTMTFTVTDHASNTATSAGMTLTVGTGATTLTVTTSSLITGTSGLAYSQQLASNGGGTGTGYTWALNSGSLTGSGITLSSAGLLSGSNPVTGSYGPLVFKVTDSGASTALSPSMTLTVQAAGTVLAITNTSPLNPGTAGSPYLQFLTAANGTPPYRFTLATGSSMPPGLVIDNRDPVDDEAGSGITDEFGADITSEA